MAVKRSVVGKSVADDLEDEKKWAMRRKVVRS
jgi:hypothetical protein